MASAISWFEIPAVDINRAAKFYEEIFQFKMVTMDMGEVKMRVFPVADTMKDIAGVLISVSENHKPSEKEGVVIYLNANPDVKIILDRVEKAGGKILMEKTTISEEHGYMGFFKDTEGNRVGLHSVPEKYLGDWKGITE